MMVVYMSDADIFLGLDNPDIIDLRILALSLGNDVAMLCEFIQTGYLLSARQGLSEIKKSILINDHLALKQAGHKYKSSAKTIGALALADLFFRLERLPEDNPMIAALIICSDIEDKLAEIEAVIASFGCFGELDR